MNDLVSIIIPTYNRALYIDRAIESILNQSYKNIEIIIVDDNGLGSENQKNTEKSLEKYAENPKIKLIINSENIGGAESRNNGFKHSTGKFISFLDDDDTYDKNKIMEQIKLIENDQTIDVCYCGMSYLDISGKKVGKRNHYLEGSTDLINRHIYRPITGTPTLLMKRNVFNSIDGFDSLKRYQDANIIFKLLANGFIFKCVEEELVNVYLHQEDRITNPKTRIKFEYEYIKNCFMYLDKLSYKSSKLLLDKYHMLKILSKKQKGSKKILTIVITLRLRLLNWMNFLGLANYIKITLYSNDN